MKFVGGDLSLHYTNVAPEIAIDGVLKLFWSKSAVHAQICDLSLGVNARIGTARADDLYLGVLKHACYALEFALYRSCVFLHLPSVKVGAVVLDQELIIHRLYNISNRSQQIRDRSPNSIPNSAASREK